MKIIQLTIELTEDQAYALSNLLNTIDTGYLWRNSKNSFEVEYMRDAVIEIQEKLRDYDHDIR